MIFKKKTKNITKTNDSEEITRNLKQGMINSLLRKKTSELTSISDNVEHVTSAENKVKSNHNDSDVSKLITLINQIKDRQILPKVNLVFGQISYPMLTQIGKDENDVSFLESLCTHEQIFEKIIYERILVCPQHQNSFSSNIRLYCPKCNSMDIKKLHLLEHTKCGYISEQTNFETNLSKITKCPSCNKTIEDPSKELRIPAKWYSCNNCNEKFDNATLKLHCRDHNHDFDINSAKSFDVPSFRIKTEENGASIDTRDIIEKLKHVLENFGFTVTENYSIQGKSNHYHSIDLFGINQHKKTISIFIKKSDSEIDNSEINSKIIQVLDTSPNIAILIGFSSISERAKIIAASYNVSIVASHNPDNIIDSTNKILAKNLGITEKNEIKP